MLGSGGDSQLPPWFAWLSQDWFAGDDDDCGHTGNDSVANYGIDPFLNRLSMVKKRFFRRMLLAILASSTLSRRSFG